MTRRKHKVSTHDSMLPRRAMLGLGLAATAAAVVGGTALSGGVGGVVGTVGGALFITEANSFTNIAHLASGAQFIVQGVIIAASVQIYAFLARPGAQPGT